MFDPPSPNSPLTILLQPTKSALKIAKNPTTTALRRARRLLTGRARASVKASCPTLSFFEIFHLYVPYYPRSNLYSWKFSLCKLFRTLVENSSRIIPISFFANSEARSIRVGMHTGDKLRDFVQSGPQFKGFENLPPAVAHSRALDRYTRLEWY